MKRLFSILLCIVMMLNLLSGCSSGGGAAAGEETVAFTDSLGRTVQIPKELTRIAPSGSVATMILATIAPEYMVSVSATPSSAQYRYLPQNLLTLPTTGQMYGSKSTLNLETLLSCNAQLVIDFGDRKENMEQDLDALQKQIGIPVIFLEADVAHMEKMYRTLGSILSGKEARGNELADFAAETVAMAAENSAKITDEERVRVMYTSGVSGLDTNADGSTQAQVLSLVGAENAVVVPEVSNRGGGNTINLEQLYNFDPDVIVFAAGSIYGTAAEDPAWNQLSAIRDGRYYEIPGMPYNWLSNPPSINMLLGVWWLGSLLYPQYYDYDMTEKTQEAFRVLWDYELSADEAEEMLQNSALMLMYGREAQSKTRIASPATIPKSGERNRKIHSCMLYLISI